MRVLKYIYNNYPSTIVSQFISSIETNKSWFYANTQRLAYWHKFLTKLTLCALSSWNILRFRHIQIRQDRVLVVSGSPMFDYRWILRHKRMCLLFVPARTIL